MHVLQYAHCSAFKFSCGALQSMCSSIGSYERQGMGENLAIPAVGAKHCTSFESIELEGCVRSMEANLFRLPTAQISGPISQLVAIVPNMGLDPHQPGRGAPGTEAL
eukprot:3491455-Rhodomonas_salina.1